jgi:nucleotide-binding universal stress UspA family protein
MPTQRIVFGDDGSAHADAAWGWINQHSWSGWTVDVLRVAPAQIAPSPNEDRVEPDADPQPPRAGDSRSGLSVSHLRATGDPRVVLAAIDDADLLVVGTRGRGLMKSMHLGSTSEWLLQAPPVPLLLVNQNRPCRNFLVCVDGSEHSTAAVTALAGWPWLKGISIEVLAVDDGRISAEVAVETAIGTLASSGATITGRVVPLGDELFVNVRTPILERIRDLEPDLVVAGTRGLTGLERLRVGSVATAIVHHSPAATLLASAGD